MQVNMYGAADAARKRSAEQTAQQRDQGDADEGNAAASHELFYPQLGVKLCSMAGGGVQKIEGARDSFLVEDVENREQMTELVRITCEALRSGPQRKRRK